MARQCRRLCGQCRYRTPWLSESAAADRQWQHYVRRHPEMTPGGRMEYRTSRSYEGLGCLALVSLLLLFLLLAASCHHRTASVPVPRTAGTHSTRTASTNR